MSKPFRFGSAVSLAALASAIAGCAPRRQREHRPSAARPDGDVGLATRALAALNANDFPTAIELAERAVDKTPDDAGFRRLLGNAYFAGGRFASAEAAFKDSLPIYSNQPQVVLKLALVEIAQGKNDEAVAFLDAGRDVLDPADYGLALALAGRTDDAVAVLEPAAREPGADARVRQNLALAYAFRGDWTKARTIAAQDVPANKLDARIQQWMQLAKPGAGVGPGRGADRRHSGARSTRASRSGSRCARPTRQVAQAAPCAAAPAPQPQVADAAPVVAAAGRPPQSVSRCRCPRPAPVRVAEPLAPPPPAASRPSLAAAIAPKRRRRSRVHAAQGCAPVAEAGKARRAPARCAVPPRAIRQRRGRSARRLPLAAAGRRRLERS